MDQHDGVAVLNETYARYHEERRRLLAEGAWNQFTRAELRRRLGLDAKPVTKKGKR